MCGTPAVAGVRDDFLSTMDRCREITLADCRVRSPLTRLLHSVYRLFSPLF